MCATIKFLKYSQTLTPIRMGPNGSMMMSRGGMGMRGGGYGPMSGGYGRGGYGYENRDPMMPRTDLVADLGLGQYGGYGEYRLGTGIGYFRMVDGIVSPSLAGVFIGGWGHNINTVQDRGARC